MSIMDTLTEHYGPLPGYAWVALGGGAIALLAISRRGSTPVGPVQVVPNQAANPTAPAAPEVGTLLQSLSDFLANNPNLSGDITLNLPDNGGGIILHPTGNPPPPIQVPGGGDLGGGGSSGGGNPPPIVGGGGGGNPPPVGLGGGGGSGGSTGGLLPDPSPAPTPTPGPPLPNPSAPSAPAGGAGSQPPIVNVPIVGPVTIPAWFNPWVNNNEPSSNPGWNYLLDPFYNAAYGEVPRWDLAQTGPASESNRARVWRWTFDRLRQLGYTDYGRAPTSQVLTAYLGAIARLRTDYAANRLNWSQSGFAGYDPFLG